MDSDESYIPPGPLDTFSDSLSDQFDISTNLIESNVIKTDESEVKQKKKKKKKGK